MPGRRISSYEFSLGGQEFTIRRSYRRDVYEKLDALAEYSSTVLSRLRYGPYAYPLVVISPRRATRGAANILISAGVHGDEPAGVYAVVDLLSEGTAGWGSPVNIYAFPCVNPSGFEIDTLETMTGANLNRLFGDEPAAENREIMGWLDRSGIAFDLTMDLHEIVPDYVGEGFVESDNPRGCYLYEWRKDHPGPIGRKLLAMVRPKADICQWDRIYHDVSDRGLISYPEACLNPVYALRMTFDAYLIKHHTRHAFTTETPAGWPLEKRIRTQSSWVRHAIRLCAHRAGAR